MWTHDRAPPTQCTRCWNSSQSRSRTPQGRCCRDCPASGPSGLGRRATALMLSSTPSVLSPPPSTDSQLFLQTGTIPARCQATGGLKGKSQVLLSCPHPGACSAVFLAWDFLPPVPGAGRAASMAILELGNKAQSAAITHPGLWWPRNGGSRQQRKRVYVACWTPTSCICQLCGSCLSH